MDTAPPTHPFSEPARIGGEGTPRDALHCIRCGYDLSGLTDDASCPECNTPVQRSRDSLRGRRLRDCTPQYVATLHRGILIVELTLIAAALFFVGGIAYAIFFDTAFSFAGPGIASAGNDMLLSIGTFCLSTASWFGWYLFTQPEVREARDDPGRVSRAILRWSVVVMSVSSAVSFIEQLVHDSSGDGAVTVVGSIVNFAASIASYFAFLRYNQVLMARVPEPGLIRYSSHMMWLGPVLCTVGCVVLFLGPLAAYVLYFVLVDRIRVTLKRTQLLAECAR
jgi:hypothetical protein